VVANLDGDGNVELDAYGEQDRTSLTLHRAPR
jgi:hypothetical protein